MKNAFVLALSSLSLPALVVLAAPQGAYAIACANGVNRRRIRRAQRRSGRKEILNRFPGAAG
jgi:hypothetical protein